MCRRQCIISWKLSDGNWGDVDTLQSQGCDSIVSTTLIVDTVYSTDHQCIVWRCDV